MKTILKGLDAPNGIVFSKGTLYVAERNRITRYDGIEDKLDNPPEPKIVIDGLDPTKQAGHFWKFLALGPDGKLYFNIGAPRQHRHAGLHPGDDLARRSHDQACWRTMSKACATRSVSTGIRKTKQLWFTEHGRDWISDDMPAGRTQRRQAQGRAFRLSLLPPGRHARPRVRQESLLRAVHAAGAEARRARRAARACASTPARCSRPNIKNNIFMRDARLVEPHDQAGLQRNRVVLDAKGKVQDRAVPRRAF